MQIILQGVANKSLELHLILQREENLWHMKLGCRHK